MPGLTRWRARYSSISSGVLLVVGDRVGPRADDRHGAAEHVEELRQLVERGAPQDPADAGHARIVLGRLDAAWSSQRSTYMVRNLKTSMTSLLKP